MTGQYKTMILMGIGLNMMTNAKTSNKEVVTHDQIFLSSRYRSFADIFGIFTYHCYGALVPKERWIPINMILI